AFHFSTTVSRIESQFLISRPTKVQFRKKSRIFPGIAEKKSTTAFHAVVIAPEIDSHRPVNHSLIAVQAVEMPSVIESQIPASHSTIPDHTPLSHSTTASQFEISSTSPAIRAMMPTTIHVI